MAENILKYHSFASPKDTIKLSNFSEEMGPSYLMYYPDGWMMPAYPVFLAAVYSVAGVHPFVAIFIQLLLSLLSVVLIYRIGMLLFKNNTIAALAALIYAIDIHSIYSANEMLTDTLFVLLLLAGTYYFLKGMLSGKFTVFFIGTMFIGLACLTRLLVMIYPVVLIMILLFFSKNNWKWKLKATLSYLLVIFFVAGIWSYRNYRQYERWQVTTHSGWTLLFYYASFTKQRVTHQNLDSIRVAFQEQADSLGFRKSKNIFDQSAIYNKVASAYIKEHKGAYVVANLQGCLNMFLAIGNRGMATTFGWNKNAPKESFAVITPQRILENFTVSPRETILGLIIMLFLALQYIGAFIGIIKLFIHRKFMVVSLILLSIAYFAAVSGVLGTYRFKLPVVPMICIAAGYGYGNLKKKEQETPKVE